MLMANVVKCILLKHQRQVAHLYYPNAVLVEAFAHIDHELVGVLEVVEHGYARDNFCLPFPKCGPVGGAIEEIVDDPASSLLRILQQVGCRLEPCQEKPFVSIRPKQSAVIAADVKGNVPIANGN